MATAGARRGGPQRPARKTKGLNPLQKLQRGRVIIEMRSRERPVAWKDIAKEVGVGVTHAQEIYRQALEWEEPLHDPMKALDETIDSLTVAVHAAWDTYVQAEAGSSAAVQALRAAADVTMQRLAILRAAGRAPRSLAGPSMEAEMRALFMTFADLLRRHNVPDEALRDLIAISETRMGQAAPPGARVMPAIEHA